MSTENIRHRIKEITANWLSEDTDNFEDVTITKYWIQDISWIGDHVPLVEIIVETVSAEEVAIGNDINETTKGRAYYAIVAFHCWENEYIPTDDYEEKDDCYNAILLSDKVMNRLFHVSPTSSLFASGIISWGEPDSYNASSEEVRNMRRYIVRTQLHYYHY